VGEIRQMVTGWSQWRKVSSAEVPWIALFSVDIARLSSDARAGVALQARSFERGADRLTPAVDLGSHERERGVIHLEC
jgi:hypothetical protein